MLCRSRSDERGGLKARNAVQTEFDEARPSPSRRKNWLAPVFPRASKSCSSESPGGQVSDPLTDSLTLVSVPSEGSNKSKGVLRKYWSRAPGTLIVKVLVPRRDPRGLNRLCSPSPTAN